MDLDEQRDAAKRISCDLEKLNAVREEDRERREREREDGRDHNEEDTMARRIDGRLNEATDALNGALGVKDWC